MLQLFKKIFKPAPAVAVAEKSSQDIIREIHNEFDTSVERLLKQAKELAAGYNEEHYEQLTKLGFHSSKNVVGMWAARAAVSNAELALVYQQRYPFNKFIIQDEVSKICEKYNLICGSVGDFTGSIPSKNIREMVNFKLKDEDCQEIPVKRYSSKMMHNSYTTEYHEESNTGIRGYINKGSLYKVDDENKKSVFIPAPLRICAPITDFNMRNKTVGKDYMIVDDPIVLQPIKGGYLIVTKWGLEASDPLIINNIEQ